MHDELLYEQAAVHTIRLSLENGSADVTAVPDAEDVRILIDTDAEDAASLLYADVKDGTLTIRQRTPLQQLLKARKRPSLHVTIETPATWKGALHAATVSGHLHAEGSCRYAGGASDQRHLYIAAKRPRQRSCR